MDERQFEDLQRRGAVTWVDPEQERKEKAQQWGLSAGAGLLCGIVSFIFSPNWVTIGAATFLGFLVVFIMGEKDSREDHPSDWT